MVICLGTRILLGVGWRPACLQPRGDDPSGAEGTMGELGGLTCKVPVPSWVSCCCCRPRLQAGSLFQAVLCGAGEAQTLRSEGHMGIGYSDSHRDQEGLGGLGLLVVARTLCLKP